MTTRTLGDLRDDLRARLDETTARYWTDKELNRWINEGSQDIARRAECLPTAQQIAVAATVGTVTMPTDGFRLHRAEYSNDSGVTVYPLEFRDPNEMDEFWIRRTQQNYRPSFLVPQGYPPNWTATIYPVPSSAGTLTVYYYRTAIAANNDTDDIDLPAGWEDLTILYASYVALRKDSNPGWKDAKDEYTEKLGALIDTTQRYHDQGGFIVSGPSLQPGWLVGDFDGVY